MQVTLDHISKHFGNVQALQDLSLTIQDGEFLSIVGPSGCGKTTSLRLIAGFIQPDTGNILFGQDVVNQVAPKKRNVGIVFQNYALFPNLNVADNIAFGLQARKIPASEIAPKVSALIRLVKLEGKEAARPRELSGGQQQRVALARALAISPKILLLDEPLSALDAKVRLMLRYEIKRIQQQAGITTIYVTHDQEEALSISDRVVVMEKGVIQQVGAPETIYKQPANQFVASFIGISNILTATVISQERGEISWNGITLYTPAFQRHTATVQVVIRPEKITLVAESDFIGLEGSEGNLLTGHVEGKVFFGPTIRLAVNVQGTTLFVDVPEVVQYHVKGGEAVSLYFHREDVWVLSS